MWLFKCFCPTNELPHMLHYYIAVCFLWKNDLKLCVSQQTQNNVTLELHELERKGFQFRIQLSAFSEDALPVFTIELRLNNSALSIALHLNTGLVCIHKGQCSLCTKSIDTLIIPMQSSAYIQSIFYILIINSTEGVILVVSYLQINIFSYITSWCWSLDHKQFFTICTFNLLRFIFHK